VLRVAVGTFTNASGEFIPADFGSEHGISRGLHTFTFDPRTGAAGPVTLAAEVSNPANLIAAPGVLYACRGQSSRLAGQSPVTAFAVSPDGFRELGSLPSGGLGPTVGVVDRARQYLLTTNWITSSVVSLVLAGDGRPVRRAALVGRDAVDGLPAGTGGAPGDHLSAEDIAAGHTKPHDVALSSDERFALVAEIAANRCRVLRFDTTTGALEPHGEATAPPGSGPRHLTLHGDRLYTSDEEGAALSVWAWHEQAGTLRHLQQVSTVPPGVDGSSEHPADVRVHPNGRFVYVTNRSVGTIAAFAIDSRNGTVRPAGHTTIGSAACWSLVFDPSGRWAFATAIRADEVRIHEVDVDSGTLRFVRAVSVPLPTCVRLLT
jgi:6-phosphogluconolactonase